MTGRVKNGIKRLIFYLVNLVPIFSPTPPSYQLLSYSNFSFHSFHLTRNLFSRFKKKTKSNKCFYRIFVMFRSLSIFQRKLATWLLRNFILMEIMCKLNSNRCFVGDFFKNEWVVYLKKSFFEFKIVKIIFLKVIIKSGKSINECRRIIKIDDTMDFIAKLPDFEFWDPHIFSSVLC